MMLIRPESPSKHVALTSALVGAATSHRVFGSFHAHQAICSAAVRVLPAPRPASINQIDHQSPWGSVWCRCCVAYHFMRHAHAT